MKAGDRSLAGTVKVNGPVFLIIQQARWVCFHGSSRVSRTQVLLKDLEKVQYHSHHFILVKESHKSRVDTEMEK